MKCPLQTAKSVIMIYHLRGKELERFLYQKRQKVRVPLVVATIEQLVSRRDSLKIFLHHQSKVKVKGLSRKSSY